MEIGHTEPTYKIEVHQVGDLKLTFKGENWGRGLVDTSVYQGDSLLCWITWDDKDAFINDINEVINKYRI